MLRVFFAVADAVEWLIAAVCALTLFAGALIIDVLPLVVALWIAHLLGIL